MTLLLVNLYTDLIIMLITLLYILLFILFTDGNDYIITELLLTFDSVTTTIDVPVTIIGDTIFEHTESFDTTLSFPGAPVPRVTLAPDSAQTTILDDDGRYISLIVSLCSLYICVYPLVLTFGFKPTVYSVSEGDGSVDLGIFFISGNAGEFVPSVITHTSDRTATGVHYVMLLSLIIS